MRCVFVDATKRPPLPPLFKQLKCDAPPRTFKWRDASQRLSRWLVSSVKIDPGQPLSQTSFAMIHVDDIPKCLIGNNPNFPVFFFVANNSLDAISLQYIQLGFWGHKSVAVLTLEVKLPGVAYHERSLTLRSRG